MKIYETPEKILQDLIRFDTSNPPGNEQACIDYLQDLLERAGIECERYAKADSRPNLVARIKGRGEAPPLLLYGHVDVVTTAGQKWTHPPFEAHEVDGFIWGRGAVDMKSGVAMMIAAMLRAKAEGLIPAGDILLLVVSDEEGMSEFGTKFMVEEHPEVFAGVRYALGEFGGASVWIAGKKFYPIQVAERQICTLELVVKGSGGHGASGVSDNAMGKLAKVLENLTGKKLPVHITEPARLMVERMADNLSGAQKFGLKGLLVPGLTDIILDKLGSTGAAFMPIFHNTAHPTIVQGGEKRNVIPSEIRLTLDGRMLPGFLPEDFISELRALIGFNDRDVEINIIAHESGPAELDMGLFEHLAGVLRDMDPGGEPIPLLLPQVTDARHLAKLGIQSYGFTPMILPQGFEFFNLAHAPDERIPIEAVRFGAEGIHKALRGYSG